jgi:hypothetical protein
MYQKVRARVRSTVYVLLDLWTGAAICLAVGPTFPVLGLGYLGNIIWSKEQE